MNYEPISDGFRAQVETVVFQATQIRSERTGIHAKVAIGLGGRILDEDNFNVGRLADRVRLVNSALKQTALPPEYPKERLHNDLLMFTRGLWDEHQAQLDTMPTLTMGDAEPSPPDFCIRDYVLNEGGTFLFAPGGQGKSWTGLLMAASMQSGVDKLWDVVGGGPALYVNLERSESSMKRRLGQVNECLGLDRTTGLSMIHARGQSLADVLERAKRYVEANHVRLLVLDSLSRAGAGDLNTNQAANAACDMLNGLGCSWIAIAHTPRADPSHIYGSSMFENAADITVQLLTQQPTRGFTGVRLHVSKVNDVIAAEDAVWSYQWHPDHGLTHTSRSTFNFFPEQACEWRDSDGGVCGRLTWDGVTPEDIRCKRHRE